MYSEQEGGLTTRTLQPALGLGPVPQALPRLPAEDSPGSLRAARHRPELPCRAHLSRGDGHVLPGPHVNTGCPAFPLRSSASFPLCPQGRRILSQPSKLVTGDNHFPTLNTPVLPLSYSQFCWISNYFPIPSPFSRGNPGAGRPGPECPGLWRCSVSRGSERDSG